MGGKRAERIDFDGLDDRHRTTWTVVRRKSAPKKDGSGEEFVPWRVVLRYWVQGGTDEDGRPVFVRRQRTHTLGDGVATEKGAKDAAGRWVAELKAAQEKADANVAERREREEAQRQAEEERKKRAAKLTVWQCVDRYITSSLAGNYIEASTAKDYRACESRIRATLGDMPLDELTAARIIEWQTALEETHAHSTVKKTRSLMRMAVQDAMDRGLTSLEKNPVVTVRQRLDDRRRDRDNAPKLNALDRDGRSTLLAYLDRSADSPVNVAARIALYAGLREGEVCALQWRDIVLDEGLGTWFVNVNKAIGKREAGPNKSATYIKPQKNDATEREIPIHPELLKVLARWKRHQQRIATLAGVPIDDTFVIGDPSIKPPRECFAYLWGCQRRDERQKFVGNPDAKPAGSYNPARLSREWRTVSRESGALGMLGRPASFHNLRHSFGYFAAGEGDVKIEKLAEWMGHESIATTKRYYLAKDKAAARTSSAEAMGGIARDSVVREKRGELHDISEGTAA